MRTAADLHGLTAEGARRQGRQDRLWGRTGQITAMLLLLLGGFTLVPSFGIFLLQCMGYDLSGGSDGQG